MQAVCSLDSSSCCCREKVCQDPALAIILKTPSCFIPLQKYTQLGAGIAQLPTARDPFASRRQGPAGLATGRMLLRHHTALQAQCHWYAAAHLPLPSLVHSSHTKLLFVSCYHTVSASFNSSGPVAGFPSGCWNSAPKPGWDPPRLHKPPPAQHPLIDYPAALN